MNSKSYGFTLFSGNARKIAIALCRNVSFGGKTHAAADYEMSAQESTFCRAVEETHNKLQNCKLVQNLMAFSALASTNHAQRGRHEVHPSHRWGQIYFHRGCKTAQLADIKHHE